MSNEWPISKKNFHDHPDRKTLTFEQREGVASLPAQLKPGEVNDQLRAVLWDSVFQFMSEDRLEPDDGYGPDTVEGRWLHILSDAHVHRDFLRVDQFSREWEFHKDAVGAIFEHGKYHEVFGWLEFVLKHKYCPQDFAREIEARLRDCGAAYRIVDGCVFCPIASEAEGAVLNRAFDQLRAGQFSGTRTHLRNAATNLTQGRYAESVRESITAIESIARVLEPSGDFSTAISRLEAKVNIHNALKRGFLSLYGYTSDEKGIRHALLSNEGAEVDEADAIFFIGACAAFITYLINKSRKAGLVE